MAKKASNEQLLSAYAELGNVWRVAERFGMCGQSVHERLTKLDAIVTNRFTEQDIARIRNEYEAARDAGKLAELAASMGRDKTTLCGMAGKLGMTKVSGRPMPWADSIGTAVAKRWATHGHPRGMLGKHHSPESRAKMSASLRKAADARPRAKKREAVLKTLRTKAERGILARHRPGVTWRGGWREVGGKRSYYRSRWEANYARYLQWLKEDGVIADWEHEPFTFWFEKARTGAACYLPDFRVTELDGGCVYHEVKGWLDKRSASKLRRMRSVHPDVKILVIDRSQYVAVSKRVAHLIPEWEHSKDDKGCPVPKGMLI